MQTEETSSRLFQNDFLERLTHVHHNTPFFIFGPVFAVCLYVSHALYFISPLALTLWFAFGILMWTLFEYTLHRFVFHFEPKSEFGKKALYPFHGIHHDFPMEADRLVMPPITSLGIAVVLFTLLYITLSEKTFPLFAGFLIGYLYYEFVHYSVHHKKQHSLGWTREQQKNHLQHHFKDADHRFGVTTTLWDHVFRTYKLS